MQEYTFTTQGPLVLTGYIDKDDATPINVYWGAPTFVPSAIYLINDLVKPTIANGYYYKCIATGVADSVEPSWTKKTTSGTARFKAISYDLFVKYDEVLTSSSWTVTDGVTLSATVREDERTCVTISAIPVLVTTFNLTNQVTKSNGASLSRTFTFTVNEQ